MPFLSAERNALKEYYRGPAKNLIKDYMSPVDAAKRFERVGGDRFASSAGKSNPGWNGAAGLSALNAINNQVNHPGCN